LYTIPGIVYILKHDSIGWAMHFRDATAELMLLRVYFMVKDLLRLLD